MKIYFQGKELNTFEQDPRVYFDDAAKIIRHEIVDGKSRFNLSGATVVVDDNEYYCTGDDFATVAVGSAQEKELFEFFGITK